MSFRALVKKFIPAKIFATIEPYGHWVEAVIENLIFGFPTRKLKVIGVTGTAGKTTTCTLITHMLRESGLKVAMITTVSIDYGDGKGAKPNTTRLTSLGSLKLLKEVKRINSNKVEWLVLETTSQALAQHRVWAVPFTIVAFTNLTHDNYHYHGTFERYRDAKLMLFKQCNSNRKGSRIGVVNADDENSELFRQAIKNPITYGLKKGDLKASDMTLSARGTKFKVKTGQDEYDISSQLPGEFNVYNCLAAIGVGRAVGLDKAQIEQGIANLAQVEGRMNFINEGQDFSVIVDYAPTPDGFTKVFKAIKPVVKGQIIVVFGSAGRRDKLKRPIQGEIAGKQADIVIITEEDDRDEDGQLIMEEIAAGVKKAGKKLGKNLFLIHQREEAVQTAIDLANTDDLVLLLGKGEEKVIITNKPGFEPSAGHIFNESTDTITRPYNETDAARTALKKRFKKT